MAAEDEGEDDEVSLLALICSLMAELVRSDDLKLCEKQESQ